MDSVPALSTSMTKCHALLFSAAVPVSQPPAQRTAPALLPVVVPREVHAELFALPPEAAVAIDLESQTLTLAGGRKVEFPIDPFAKHCLLNGIDELGYIRQQEDAIAAFEARCGCAVNTLG